MNIKEFRQQFGLTQEKLAQKLGVSFTTINRWERGKSEPSPLALEKLENLIKELGGKVNG